MTNIGGFVAALRLFGGCSQATQFYFGRQGRMSEMAIVSNDLCQAHAKYARAPQYQKAELAKADHLGPNYIIVGKERDREIIGFCESLIAASLDTSASDLGRLIELHTIGDSLPAISGTESPSPIHRAWIEEFGSPLASVDFNISSDPPSIRISKRD